MFCVKGVLIERLLNDLVSGTISQKSLLYGLLLTAQVTLYPLWAANLWGEAEPSKMSIAV